ncbi:hypothetical protein ULMS_14940 [Patiriisocius marinistellae]|uniref:DUF4252 domain-containing protein n=1 Tax=Patiriisocius marinistellae TaxID=2494560 RepID=A0A5J4G0I8_9FLAO|nr:DUF4252 domain-containing protein [Patiriisocius marinistellae]GEQ85986.1 hypothetical protein ULMS_14940 [Patiriisocius marinistellae]
MNIVKIILGLSLAALSFISCNTDKSLQVYIVDKQEDDRFMKLDLATSLIEDAEGLDEENRKILKTIKKINVVAYQKEQGTDADYQTEKAKLDLILSQEKYHLLSKFKSNNQLVTLKYIGDDTTIDEVIVYGSDDQKGLALFRLLGNNMKPENLANLAMSLEKGGFNLSDMTGMSGIEDIFKE